MGAGIAVNSADQTLSRREIGENAPTRPRVRSSANLVWVASGGNQTRLV